MTARRARETAALEGQLSCYGLGFGPVSLGNGFNLSPGSTVKELFGQAQAALRKGRPVDLERLTEILGGLDGGDPLGRCGMARG